VIAARSWLALGAALMLAAAGPAAAHSLLIESTPAANATLTAPPRQLALRFNNRIEKALSRVRLVDARGGGQPLVLTVDGGGAGDRLTAAVPPLAPGPWRVEWQVLSTDGHVVSGRFEFRLAPSH
jgi:methionine-rich copper-binding protein CopC